MNKIIATISETRFDIFCRDEDSLQLLLQDLEAQKELLGGDSKAELKRYNRGTIAELTTYDLAKHTINGILALEKPLSKEQKGKLSQQLASMSLEGTVQNILERIYESKTYRGSRAELMNGVLQEACGFVFHKEYLDAVMDESHPTSIYQAKSTLLASYEKAREKKAILAYFRTFNTSLPCYENRLELLQDFSPVSIEPTADEKRILKEIWNSKKYSEKEKIEYTLPLYEKLSYKAYWQSRNRCLDELDEEKYKAIREDFQYKISPYNNDLIGYRDFLIKQGVIKQEAATQLMRELFIRNTREYYENGKLFNRVLPRQREDDKEARSGGGLSKDFEHILSRHRLPYLPATLLIGPAHNYNTSSWNGCSGVFLNAPVILIGKRDFGSDKYIGIFSSNPYKEAMKTVRTERELLALHKKFWISYKGQYPDIETFANKLRESERHILRERKGNKASKQTKEELLDYWDRTDQKVDISELDAKDGKKLDLLSDRIRQDESLDEIQKKAFLHVLQYKLKKEKFAIDYFSKPSKINNYIQAGTHLPRNECILYMNNLSAIQSIYVRMTPKGVRQAKEIQTFLKKRLGIEYPCFSYAKTCDSKENLNLIDDLDKALEIVESVFKEIEEGEVKEVVELIKEHKIPVTDVLKKIIREARYEILEHLFHSGDYKRIMLNELDESIFITPRLWGIIKEVLDSPLNIDKESALAALARLAHYNNGNKKRVIIEGRGIEVILNYLKDTAATAKGKEFALYGLSLLIYGNKDCKDIRKACRKVGSIEVILNYIRDAAATAKGKELALYSLLVLIYNNKDRKAVRKAGGIEIILNYLGRAEISEVMV